MQGRGGGGGSLFVLCAADEGTTYCHSLCYCVLHCQWEPVIPHHQEPPHIKRMVCAEPSMQWSGRGGLNSLFNK